MAAPADNSGTTTYGLRMYKYRRLNRETQETRLVKVLPGQFDDALQLEIKHVPLIVPEPAQDERLSFDELVKTIAEPWTAFKTIEGRYIFYNTTTERTQWDHPDPNIVPHMYYSDVILGRYPDFTPQYEALSYAWGADTTITNVEIVESLKSGVNIQPVGVLPIRPNLHHGLKHLRYSDKPRTLWIDAICINQHDLAERNAEVKRMDNVFKLASRVVVWLGLASSDGSSRHALRLLRYLSEQVEYSTSMAFFRAPTAQEMDWYDYDIPLPYNERDYSAIERVLERSWWDRLWIWQEIHLANSHAVFQCGSDSIPWPSLRRAILNLRERTHLAKSSIGKLLNARVDLARDHKHEAVLDLIFKTRHALYTTPHDRIFALFGLFDPRFVDKIQSDYSLPLVDVFKNVCLAILHYYGHVKFLEHCDITQHTINDIPSWVPNWSIYPLYEKLDLGFASGRSAASNTFYRVDSGLEVNGVICGTVQGVGHAAPLEGDIRAVLRSWEARLSQAKETKEAFVATLLDGLVDERWPDRGNATIQRNVELYDRYMSGAAVGGFTDSVSRFVRGRSLFQTDSYIGLGPSSARTGDVLCVILGCGNPLILRPCGDATYQVVGPVYVHGLMDGEALLGPLPPNWTVYYSITQGGYEVQAFKDANTGTVTFEDPRLGLLHNAESLSLGRTNFDFMMLTYRESDAAAWGDPRLTKEELDRRGVAMERIVLV